jgi:ABC-2 type transport system permease protein
MTAAPTDAPRRSLANELSAAAALFALTVRQHTHGRRLLILGGLYLLPCLLAVVLRLLPSPAPTDALEFALVFTLVPHALAPLTALLYAAGVVADEVEEQTLTYLLLRAVPRWLLYLTKLLATLCVTCLLVAVSVAALYVAIYAGSPDFWPATGRCVQAVGVMALAQVGYCGLFGLIGLLTRRSLIVGIGYIVLVEGVLANLNFVGRAVTLVYHTRSLTLRGLDLPADQLRRCQDVSLLSALLFARSEYRVKTPGDR